MNHVSRYQVKIVGEFFSQAHEMCRNMRQYVYGLFIFALLIPLMAYVQASPISGKHSSKHLKQKPAFPCDAPALWLTKYDHSDIDTAYCAACSERCNSCPAYQKLSKRKRSMGWSALYGSELGCYETRYVTTRIEAYYGKPFVVHNDFDRLWQETIIKHAKNQGYPYKVDPRYSSKKIPKIARRNLAHFRQLLARDHPCKKDQGRVRQVLVGKLYTQLKQMARGKRPLPKKLVYEGHIAKKTKELSQGRDNLRRIAKQLSAFDAAHWVSPKDIRSMEDWEGVMIGSPTGRDRVIALSMDDEPPINLGSQCGEEDCEDESICGGGFRYWIHIDKNERITAFISSEVACPFVYQVNEDKGQVYLGEILRNQKGSNHDAWNTLDLRPAKTSSLHIRIAERKRETTYLDAVYLLVGNQSILPEACKLPAAVDSATQTTRITSPAQKKRDTPDYCNADGRYHQIPHGDSIDLHFQIPEGLGMVSPVLRAKGYYMPKD